MVAFEHSALLKSGSRGPMSNNEGVATPSHGQRNRTSETEKPEKPNPAKSRKIETASKSYQKSAKADPNSETEKARKQRTQIKSETREK